jgi:sugar lactone lactonase YvrE
MRRCRCFVLAILFLIPLRAVAQDMPLSQILIDGEGWREAAKGSKPSHDRSARVETKSGYRYSVNPEKGVILLHGKLAKGEETPPKEMKVPGLVKPSCLVLWNDQGTLVVGDAGGKHLWAFRIEKDGSLSAGDRYYPLRMRPGEKASGVTAMTVDAKGRLYACTPLGVQVFDPTGRLCGLLLNPTGDTPSAIVFGGEGGSSLIIAAGEKVFARKLQPKAVSSP